ncbi:hydroxysteroid dehydrogenase-like protein 2 [Plakobranchus ocellatus]|uniref:Hydroxysteroid dehydrogenase-like protein 2 n=1 Tax=Plakobranchus ocellatus TaxID=259542 RepID=A0AAV4A8Q0_9GAST|nr:hydroxysteroid dehydrogenase-like protein 2 [Plakobranchus ocellatus]
MNVRDAGGQALACIVDIRFEDQVKEAVEKAVQRFGGIDILVNNASAISITGTLETPMKKYDLMHNINTRGTYLCSKICLPYLMKSDNPHILNISPPLNMTAKWFQFYTVNMEMINLDDPSTLRRLIATATASSSTSSSTAPSAEPPFISEFATTSEDSDIKNEEEEFVAVRSKHVMPVCRQPLHDGDIEQDDNHDEKEGQEEEEAAGTWREGTTSPPVFDFMGTSGFAGANGRRDTPSLPSPDGQ